MFRDKLKKLLNKTDDETTEGNDKKKIENLVFFIVILIITIIAINIIWNGNKQTNKDENGTYSKQLAKTEADDNNEISNNNSNNIEERLEEILAKIAGVGDVKVFINYSESSEVIAMYNENSKTSNTEENDTSGGTRKIQEIDTQKDIIYKEENGEKTPITQKIINPKIEGAVITAKGANNAEAKTKIIQAVEAVTGLATHKIQVFEMN